MPQNPDYLLVAAIDFGTTYSGYAFSMRDTFKSDPLKIHANQAWNAGGRQLLSLKTPTCLLLDSRGELDSFGYEAENKYAELVMDGDQDDYYYFHRFKMNLHNNKNVTSDMMLEDITGKSLLAMDVFSLAIKALKDHLLLKLETQGTGVKTNEIQWVLTVPAIWSEKSKQFMRKSAEKAGIPTKSLLISLEPEAASIYCQYVPTEKLEGAEPGFTMSEPGTKYMVVDLGGGTADITVHEKMSDGNLMELCRASGGDCGGTSVDAGFIQMLAKIMGAPIVNTMKQTGPEAYLDLLREFETVKRTITPAKTGKVNIAIPYVTLDKLCNTHLEEDFPSVLSSSPFPDSISIRGDKMRIDVDIIKALFSKTIDNIIELIKEMLQHKKAESVRQLLLVGGFSECLLVQEAIKKNISNRRVIVPEEAGLTVLKGAVLFGHKPNYVICRVSRFTYGIATDPIFDSTKHDQSHLNVVDGVERCKNAFDVIVKKDTSVPIGKISKSYYSKKGHESVCIRIFYTESLNPKYVDEEGCCFLGKAHLKVSDCSKRNDLKVELEFGNTELSVMATETASGNQCDATFDLL